MSEEKHYTTYTEWVLMTPEGDELETYYLQDEANQALIEYNHMCDLNNDLRGYLESREVQEESEQDPDIQYKNNLIYHEDNGKI